MDDTSVKEMDNSNLESSVIKGNEGDSVLGDSGYIEQSDIDDEKRENYRNDKEFEQNIDESGPKEINPDDNARKSDGDMNNSKDEEDIGKTINGVTNSLDNEKNEELPEHGADQAFTAVENYVNMFSDDFDESDMDFIKDLEAMKDNDLDIEHILSKYDQFKSAGEETENDVKMETDEMWMDKYISINKSDAEMKSEKIANNEEGDNENTAPHNVDIDKVRVGNTSEKSRVESQKINLEKEPTMESPNAWDEEAQFNPEYNKKSELPTVEQDSKEWFEPDEGRKSDHDLPPGWTYSENGMLLSPPSIQFKFSSRLTAYQALLSSGASLTQTVAMFDSLVNEGWMADWRLPHGWIFQMTQDGQMNFFNKDGMFISTLEKTMDYVKNDDQYSTEEIENFGLLGIKSVEKNNQFKNISDLKLPGSVDEIKVEKMPDPPFGWSIKRKGLMSPSGTNYSKTYYAYQDLLKNGGSPSDIDGILKILLFKGWSKTNLPKGWIAKGETSGYTFINERGELFEGKQRALAHLEWHGSVEDKMKVESFIEGKRPPEGKRLPGKEVKDFKPKMEDNSLPKSDIRGVTKVLQDLLRGGGSQEEIQAIRARLFSHGWTDDNLPFGWIGYAGHYSSFRFISPNGEMFENKKNAVSYLIRSGGRVNEKEMIEQFSSGNENIKKCKDRKSSGFTTSKRKSNEFMDEDNDYWGNGDEAFNNYTKAAKYSEYNEKYGDLRHLYPDAQFQGENKKREPSSQSSKMMDLSNWGTNEYLPQGWLCKERWNGINVMEPGGERFHSYLKAAEFMKASGRYSMEDVKNLYLYPDGTQHMKNLALIEGNYVTSQYLPKGWRCKESKYDTIVVVSPDMKRFTSYRSAAAYMEADGRYTEDDIKRLYLYPDGQQHRDIRNNDPFFEGNQEWKTSPYLPQGWLCKDSANKGELKIITPDRQRLTSYKKAADYMEINDGYSEEDVRRLFLYPDGTQHKDIRSNEYTYYQGNPEWTTNQYLPMGWVCRQPATYVNTIEVMSPERKRFNSYRRAAEYMEADRRYTEEDVKRLYLYPDGQQHRDVRNNNTFLEGNQGWATSQYLPEGWLCKEPVNKSGIDIVSPDRLRFYNYLRAAEYMEGNDRYSEEDVRRLYLYPDGKQHKQNFDNNVPRRQNAVEWKTNVYLPEGWKCKDSFGSSRNINIMSSEGYRLSSYKHAIHYMKSNSKYSEEDIEKLLLYPSGKLMASSRHWKATMGENSQEFASSDDVNM